ncbi:MAG: hypothetical protein RL441_584 [Actinomycetota bacterium]|jgi:cytochrome b involved in lipid metabolism
MTLLKRALLSLVSALALMASTLVASPAQAETIYTAAEVHLHNKRSDCWTIVSGGVYNLTAFVARHEGGTAVIIGMCGVDATVGFLAQHQGENSPTRTLATYRIGALDPNTPPTPTTVYTVLQVREHSVASDCWSAVSGGVYDLTGWIAVHPGGAAVVTGMCGIDGTASFMSYHTGDANPISILEQFKIGIFDPTPPPVTTKYTMQQVATHSTGADCWSVVKDNVYDLTTWVNSHPGGSALIIAMCGKDGTSSFVGYHGASVNPNSVLGQFQIGVLDGTVPPPPVDTIYTMSQVAAHNLATDCWSVVKDVVYNLSAWVNAHPGGPAVVTEMCGVDGTAAFVGYHGAATNPNTILGGYKIGVLDTSVPAETKYTLTQVAAHNKQADCWTIVSGKVYNLTPFIASHPGGIAFISAMCGLDGTSFYLGQHADSAAALAALSPLQIGVLDTTVFPPLTKEYTLAQVKTHNTAADCWSIVGTSVYDLTQWIVLHPGGQAQIKAMCGLNATASFNGQHSGSASAKASLAPYKIGNFKATAVTTKYYTLTQVKAHKTRSNCWTIISGKVYNLTKWIAAHPGGSEAIIELCGRNGTADFLEGHNGDKAAAAALAPYKIGLLKTTKPVVVAKKYTLAQVATHKTSSNCWSVVGTSVYNLTKWIALHPGGQAQIKAMCGVDASAGFSGQHSGSASAKASLARYKIGVYLKSSVPKVVLKNYTAAQVATHKTSSNCWSIVSKKVYNLTKWIALHPGGQAQIKAMCGVDASAGFNGKHSGSASALASLAKYRIGTLVGKVTPPAPVETTYTAAQIRSHATVTNCWASVNGNVYSLAAWLRKQPAGSVATASVCGVDATSFLNKKFGSSAKTATALKLYKIGKLK